MHPLVRVLACGVLAAALGSACGGDSTSTETASAPAAAPVTNPVDPETISAITGTITLQGTPPPNPSINMSSDPYCLKLGAATTPTFVVSDGGNKPYRVKIRDPSFVNLQAVPEMVDGGLVADTVAVISSVDPVMGGVDR